MDTTPHTSAPRASMPWRQMLAWTAVPLAFVIGSGIMILRDRAAPRVTVLVEGGAMHGSEGLTFGPDGMMYVASMNGLAVVKVDPKTGAVSTVVGPPDAEPDDVAVGPAGTPAAGILVWTSPPRGTLGVLRPGGKPEVLMRDVPGINPVAFSKDGRLFAAQSGQNENALWEVDPMGVKPPRLVEKGEVRLNGFDFGTDGKLYAPWQGTTKLVSIDIESGEITVVAKDVGLAVGVDVDAKGNIYSVDSTEGTLWRTTPTGESKVIARVQPPFDNVTVGPDGTIYASAAADSVIIAVDPETFQARELVHGTMVTPLSLAMVHVAGKESLLIADPFGARSADPATGKVTRPPWRANRDAGIALGSNEKFTAIIGGSGVVKKIDRASDEVVWQAKAIKGARGVVVTASDDVIVSDAENGLLLRVDAEGTQQIADGLHRPAGLALDGNAVLVAEAGSGTITRIDLANGQRSEIAKDLLTPTAVARLSNGSIAVIEAAIGTVRAINPTTGKRTELARGLALDTKGLRLPITTPAGLAVGGDGTIYVSCPLDNRIVKIAAGWGE